jgi:hypothetical protein
MPEQARLLVQQQAALVEALIQDCLQIKTLKEYTKTA